MSERAQQFNAGREVRLRKIALFIIFSLSGLAFSSWISRTPEVRDILQASTSTMGWVIFGLAFGSIIGLTAASKVIARYGARLTICTSIILVSAGLFVVCLGLAIPSIGTVFAGLALFGLGYGLIEVAQSVEGSALEHQAGKTLLPLMHASFSGGTLIGAGLGSLAIKLHFDAVYHLLIIGVLIVLIVLGISKYLPNGTGKEEAVSKSGVDQQAAPAIKIWKEPRTLLIGVIVLGMAFAEGSANDWLPLIMVDGFQLSAIAGTTIYGVFLAAMLIGRISGGFFLDRYGRVLVLRVAAVSAAIGLLLVIFGSSVAIAVIGVFMWGLGASLGFPVGLSAAGDDPNGAVARVAMISTLGYVAFLAGPPVLGVLGEKIGLLQAMIVVLIGVIIAGIFSHAAKK
ncbi:MFS transporter [Cohnella boryungensis]|uniref:MFS transporter n=1 Tax=Cohnella boryungensis TaxID=768479 RepID=A0ABV8S6Y5_9BACL